MGKFNFGEDDFKVGKQKVTDASKPEVTKVSADTEKAPSYDGPSGMTGTRGRKGKALPTMNMRFSAENYEYMKRESAVRGMSTTAFVNWLIETYRSDPAHVNYTDGFKKNANW